MSVEKPDQPSTEALQAKVAELETLLAQAKSETGKESPAAVAALARAQEAIESGTASAGRIEQLEAQVKALSQKLEEALADPVTPPVTEVKVSGQAPAQPAQSPAPQKPGMDWS
jgi:aryl-alcohol dehydrogenase-like predicted oxidoreductase